MTMTEDDDTLDTPKRHWAGRWVDSYDGRELKPYAGRPGAMDAFDLPSRMGNRLVFRDGRQDRIEHG